LNSAACGSEIAERDSWLLWESDDRFVIDQAKVEDDDAK
jgi:hypothetical protein